MTEYDFTSIEKDALAAYAGSLDRIIWDLSQAENALGGDQIDFADVIHAAAHLRLVIENMVFSSLITSRQLLLEAQANLAKKRDMGDTRKLVRGVYSRYWPEGQLPNPGVGGPVLIPNPHALKEDEYSLAWGRMSEILHGRSPYVQSKREPQDHLGYQRELVKQLHGTLDFHFLYYPNNEILYGRIANGKPEAQVLRVGG